MNKNGQFLYLNTGLPQDIAYQKMIGDFDKANELIDERLKENLSDNLRACLLLEKEIMKRLSLDYTYSFEDAYLEIVKLIPDFKREELQAYLDRRRFSFIYINKEIRIFKRFLPVLKLYDDFNDRLGSKKKFEICDWYRYKTIQMMKKEGFLSYRVSIRESLKIKDESFIENENYLVHLPIPRNNDAQSDIVLEKISPEAYVIDDEDSLCRCVYWKKPLEKNEEFVVEYSYTCHYDYHELNKGSINKQYDFELGPQEPHVVFSKYIMDVAENITRGCDDPLSRARAIYDYLTLNMEYSYQPNYFVLENIVVNCLKSKRGDCGIFALTFITLCRAVGIPAHFESCKCIDEDGVGSHDWARFYVEPYGWLYADVSFGIGCHRKGYEEGRQFYFGNLDPFRMVANEAWQEDLSGDKKQYRNDPYDNQLGEVEDNSRGYIYGLDYTSSSKLLNITKQ